MNSFCTSSLEKLSFRFAFCLLYGCLFRVVRRAIRRIYKNRFCKNVPYTALYIFKWIIEMDSLACLFVLPSKFNLLYKVI